MAQTLADKLAQDRAGALHYSWGTNESGGHTLLWFTSQNEVQTATIDLTRKEYKLGKKLRLHKNVPESTEILSAAFGILHGIELLTVTRKYKEGLEKLSVEVYDAKTGEEFCAIRR